MFISIHTCALYVYTTLYCRMHVILTTNSSYTLSLHVTGTVGDLDSPMSPDQKGFASMGQVSYLYVYLASVYGVLSVLECT